MIKLITKYIGLHLGVLDRLFLYFCDKSPVSMVSLLANFRQLIVGPQRVSFSRGKDGQTFCAREHGMSRHFIERSRNIKIYSKGLRRRAVKLGEDYFLPEISFRPGDLIIDCGANVGDLKLWFDINDIDVKYIGFEPSPAEFKCLEKNVAPSVVHNAGLLDKSDHIDLFVSSKGADSSFIKPPVYSSVIKIPTRRLDDVINSNVRLLKLEAEGAEPEVLIGATQLFAKIDYVSADLGFERGLNQDSTLVEVTNILIQHNFELISFNRRMVALYKRKGVS